MVESALVARAIHVPCHSWWCLSWEEEKTKRFTIDLCELASPFFSDVSDLGRDQTRRQDRAIGWSRLVVPLTIYSYRSLRSMEYSYLRTFKAVTLTYQV